MLVNKRGLLISSDVNAFQLPSGAVITVRHPVIVALKQELKPWFLQLWYYVQQHQSLAARWTHQLVIHATAFSSAIIASLKQSFRLVESFLAPVPALFAAIT
ncbi:MAG: hypothetical protein VKI42_00830 [Synechococcaceae cyanobacterium]|nr:hypothetical protein [Synechococcaceae cyanobacterium]